MTYEDLATKTHLCSICGIEFTGWGNNPEPVVSFEMGQCCDTCNATQVIPARLGILHEAKRGPTSP